MLSISRISGVAVFAPKGTKGKAATTFSRLGKVHQVVFDQTGRRVVGVLVARPDIAGMVKREDAFVALDCLAPCDGGFLVRRPETAMDAAARSRLGLDWDRCLLWYGMDARTTEGKVLGHVSDARFDMHTGAVDAFVVGDGSMAEQLVGAVVIPADMLRGYQDGWMLVAPEAAHLAPTGGAAAKAGEGYARAKREGEKAMERAGEVAGDAVDKGSRALGRSLGRTKGMFSSFVDEFKKAQE